MSRQVEDYYQILGVTKDVTDKELQKAYRKLAHKYHPDSNKTKEAEEKFKKINEAYNVLKDPEKRKAYDNFGSAWEQGKGFYSQDTSSWTGDQDILKQVFESIFRSNKGFSSSNFGDFGGFSNMGGFGFNGKTSSSIKGNDIETELTITIKDSYYGTIKSINFRDSHGNVKRLDVNIPKGITNGKKIRLKNQGQPSRMGGANGDLLIKVNIVNDKQYRLEGINIYKELPITPWEAIFGAKITAKTFDKKIEISIPPNTESGKKFRLKGLGLSNRNGSGDFYFVSKIVLPDKLSEKEKKLIKQWQSISKFNPRD